MIEIIPECSKWSILVLYFSLPLLAIECAVHLFQINMVKPLNLVFAGQPVMMFMVGDHQSPRTKLKPASQQRGQY